MCVFLFYFVAIFSDCFDEQHVESETDDHHDRVDGKEDHRPQVGPTKPAFKTRKLSEIRN